MKFLVYSGNGAGVLDYTGLWKIASQVFSISSCYIYQQPEGGNLKPKSERNIIIDVSRCGF